MRILLIGAGGHGQVVADILRCQFLAGEPVDFIGYCDDQAESLRDDLGPEVLGMVVDAAHIQHDACIFAIGDNTIRRSLFLAHAHIGVPATVARHPRAIVASSAGVGHGSMICAGVVINPHAVIGVNSIINTAASVDHHCRIGDHVHLAPGVRLGGNVDVGEGALIGIGAVVLPRMKIGAWAVVGAGAVVVDNVPANTVVVGVPARAHRR